MFGYVLIAIVLLIIIYIFVTYNSLIKLKNRSAEAFSTMDVFLKKRWDLIPSLVETVKGFASHEENILTEITKLRSNFYDDMNASDKMDVNSNLSNEINKLMLFVESYPDLKASENFIKLSTQLTKVEDDIANSRKYYNAVVRRMNDKVQMFPSNIVAKLFGFKTLKMFGIEDNERKNVNVDLQN